MPVSPLEIALAKLWSNGLVITVATGLSLWFVVHEAVGMPIAGSVPLFLLGVALYLFFATAVGLLLGTAARSMPQAAVTATANVSNTAATSRPGFDQLWETGLEFGRTVG